MAKKDAVDTPEVVETTTDTPVVKEKKPTKAELSRAEATAFTAANPEGEKVFYGDGPFPVLSRAAAIILGFSRYNTGEPCLAGHDSPRKTKTSTCLACARLKLRDRHKRRIKEDADYKAKFAQKAKDRRLRNKEIESADAPAETPAE